MTKTICNSLIEHTQMVATNKSSQCEIFHQYVMEFMVRLYREKKKSNKHRQKCPNRHVYLLVKQTSYNVALGINLDKHNIFF